MDDSPSMQAELRSAKAELVAATKELRAALDQIEDLKAELGRNKVAPSAMSASQLAMADRFEGAATKLKCSVSHRCTIKRDLLDAVLADETRLRKQARMRTVRSKGKITGFRVDQVKEGSLAEILGLQRGDEVEKVLGVKLTKMGLLKELITKARSGKTITASVKRGKRTMTWRVSVE
jgi:S1-C subfamily serine protease